MGTGNARRNRHINEYVNELAVEVEVGCVRYERGDDRLPTALSLHTHREHKSRSIHACMQMQPRCGRWAGGEGIPACVFRGAGVCVGHVCPSVQFLFSLLGEDRE